MESQIFKGILVSFAMLMSGPRTVQVQENGMGRGGRFVERHEVYKRHEVCT